MKAYLYCTMKSVLFFILVLGFVLPVKAQQQQQQQARRVNYHAIGAPLPAFTLEKWDGTAYSSTALKPNKAVMIVIFSPDCDHCEHAIDSLMGMKDKLANTQLVFVCEAIHKSAVKPFVKKVGMVADKQFANAGIDKSGLIPNIYTNKMLPQIMLYNSKHQLAQVFDGAFTMGAVRAALR